MTATCLPDNDDPYNECNIDKDHSNHEEHCYRTDNLHCLEKTCTSSVDRPGLPPTLKPEWDHWIQPPYKDENVGHCSTCGHPKYINTTLFDKINNPLLLMAQGVNPYGA